MPRALKGTKKEAMTRLLITDTGFRLSEMMQNVQTTSFPKRKYALT